MKTCPDCNGDGVVKKARTKKSYVPHAGAVVWYRMAPTARKK
jgi:hypothetical protein